MADIPWNAPSRAWAYACGLDKDRDDFIAAPLCETVTFVLKQTESTGHGYVVWLDDKTRQWAGPRIATLGRELPGE
jgi:hypothetical protein